MLELFNKPRLYYDIESYKYDFIVVFIEENGSVYKIMHNETDGLSAILAKYTLVGYNNYFYDDKIITKLSEGVVSPHIIKNISNTIINNRDYRQHISENIYSLDCFQEISVQKPSLKLIQANKGYNIHETSIGFDIDRQLTAEELRKEINYCTNDARSLIEIFNERRDYFEAKKGLLELLQKRGHNDKFIKKAVRWNTTTLVGNLFSNSEAFLPNFTTFVDNLNIDKNVREFWKIEGLHYLKTGEHINNKLSFNAFDNDIDFGFGGLHGINTNIRQFGKLYHIDVASMYPNIINNLGLMGKYTKEYKQMIDDRVLLKKIDPKKSKTLKLILNKVYGLLNNTYSPLYSPQSMLMVCLHGQTALYNLGLDISILGTVIQMNTDGIYAYIDGEDEIKLQTIIHAWEQRFNLSMETTEYKHIYQRDVNNYITVDKADKTYVKGDLKKIHNDQFFANNSLSIVDLAVVNKITKNIDILDTIVDNLDKPRLYQYIVKCGKTFDGIYDQNEKKYQKVNRVFAVKDGVELFKLKKIKKNNTITTGWHRLPNLSDNVAVYNGDLADFNLDIDIDYYYQLAIKKAKEYNDIN